MDKVYILKRTAGLDPHGQPLNRAFSAKRLCERSTDELIGICRGLIVDGTVSEEEVLYLKSWAEARGKLQALAVVYSDAGLFAEHVIDLYLTR